MIGPTANFKGVIQSDGGLRVDGVIEGTIQIAGNLIIGETGKVIAEVSVQNISVAGALKGTVKAQGRLEILSTGRVWGDISVSSFLIDEGGFFRGQSIMPGEPDMPLLDAPAAARPRGRKRPISRRTVQPTPPRLHRGGVLIWVQVRTSVDRSVQMLRAYELGVGWTLTRGRFSVPQPTSVKPAV